jgi:2-succinyl-6-hydroxy-2,4-cyclohexadiene-1-carboxylate synthase
MARVQINSLKYFFQRKGKGSPLVLLHGFTGSGHSWNDLTEQISPQVESVAIDLPGHGQTESSQNIERYAIERTAEDIIAVADYLDLDNFSILGYSMGGRLGLYLAVYFPNRIKALILESASPGIADMGERKQRRNWDYELAERIEREGINSFVNRWETLPLFASQLAVPDEKKTSLRQERLGNNVLGLSNSLRGMGTGSQPSLWEALPTITIPTLLLCGDLDPKYMKINQDMAKMMPNAELAIFQDAGHNIHLEQTEAFSAVLSNFLLRIDPASNGR